MEADIMSAFSDAELAYLKEAKLGRLATVDGKGQPHVVPVGWDPAAAHATGSQPRRPDSWRSSTSVR
jgi:nitroimidazol reductase NimA-like FMN-containing flavoprotein (pyridoxamine 5'-phosphate oxidase superfamily)